MFARDLDPSETMRTLPLRRMWHQSTVTTTVSSRVGASEVDEGSTLDHDSDWGEAPTPTIPVGTHASRRGFESMDLVNLLEIRKKAT